MDIRDARIIDRDPERLELAETPRAGCKVSDSTIAYP
jgi:hypothetical protein